MKRELPPNMHLKHGRYYFVTKADDRTRWKPLSRDPGEALRQYAAIAGIQLTDHSEPPPAWLLHYIAVLFRRAKQRATADNIYFNLTPEDVLQLGERENWTCELTGLRFNLDRTDNARSRAFAPSLDRINSTGGYAKGNVRLVCAAVNMALNEWGEQVFRLIAMAYCRKHRIVLRVRQQLDKRQHLKSDPTEQNERF